MDPDSVPDPQHSRKSSLCKGGIKSNFYVSLDLENRESVFSPVPKKVERSEEEKREIEANLEKLSERQAATLSAAYSKKKKRR
jgi:hypothetical protein